jgi:O-antigen/teichoic acid export membrane protein
MGRVRLSLCRYATEIDRQPNHQLAMIAALKIWFAERLEREGAARSVLMLYSSQVITALAGLAYGKVTAAYIDPAQLGNYNVQLAGLLLLNACCITPLIQSFKFALQRQTVEVAVAFHAGLLWRICLLVAIGLGVTVYVTTLPIYVGLLWIALLFQSVFTFINDFLSTSFQYKAIALLQMLNPVINLLLLVVILTLWPGTQTIGLWLNYGLLYLVLLGIAGSYAYRSLWPIRSAISWTLPYNWQADWVQCRQYVTPLAIYGLFGWATAYIDRYLISYFLKPQDVGYYTIGYSLGARLAIVSTPLLAHLNPIILKAYKYETSNPLAEKSIRQHLLLFWTLSVPACLFLFLLKDQIGSLFMSATYEPAFLIVPLISVAYLFMLSNQFLETKFYATGRTQYVLWHSIAGAMLNICFNVCLIPILGINGAATAMIFSSCCQFFIVCYLFTVKYH